MAHIQLDIRRLETELVQRIGRHGAATLHEAQGRQGALASNIKPVAPGMETCGPAFTVSAPPGDNLMLQLAISYAQAGDVIAVVAGRHIESGSFGEVLAHACQARGLGGLVIEGGVRDGKELCELGFPVFSTGLCIQGTVKERLGAINEPIILGGELIRPGDILRGDRDGVVVIRHEFATEVLERADERERAEKKKIAAYRGGKTPIEVNNLEQALASKGLSIEGGGPLRKEKGAWESW